MKILLIAKFFPPASSVASHRLFSFAKYLPEFGIQVDIITPKRKGVSEYDISTMKIIYPNEETSSSTRFMKKKNILLDILKYSGVRSFKYYLTSHFFHNTAKLFKKKKSVDYDAVLCSYGTEDILRIGYFLHKKFDLPLLLDYRDPWFDNLYAKWTPLDKLVIYFLEKRIITSASLITAATKGVKNFIESRYKISAHVVYNGFFSENVKNSCKKVDGNKLKFCYCGSLYGGFQPVDVFFPILAKNPNYILDIAVFDQIDVDLINSLKNTFDVRSQVNIFINLSNNESLSLQQQADILLYLNRMDGKTQCVLATKIYEYMAIGKFIFGIGHKDDEIAQIFKDYNLGVYITKTAEMQDGINKFFSWTREKRKDISFFNRRNQAGILAEHIKNTLSV